MSESITITDLETGEAKDIDTDGYILLYLRQDKVKVEGKLDIRALAPILTKIALEKLVK